MLGKEKAALKAARGNSSSSDDDADSIDSALLRAALGKRPTLQPPTESSEFVAEDESELLGGTAPAGGNTAANSDFVQEDESEIVSA